MIYPQMNPAADRIITNMEKLIIGKREVIELSLTALLAGGHVLLEDVPGVGKTMLVRALARSMNANFTRIQFTPDLLPSDVTGTSIYHQEKQEFVFRPGPIMGHIVLADEINRTSPKTQSALLEAMEEAGITVDGKTWPLGKPFFVMATQNPIEYEGTYPLPEAQLDRFLLKMKMGYPSVEEEVEVLGRAGNAQGLEQLQPVISLEEICALQESVLGVYADESLKRYMVELAVRTRNHPDVYLGVSPRGTIALMKAAQAYALVNGRDYILPDDVQYLAKPVLAHRLILKPQAGFGGGGAEAVVEEIVRTTPVPVNRQVNKR